MVSTIDEPDRQRTRLTVLFMANAKFSKNKLKYRGPKLFVNMKMKQPTNTIGIGYTKKMYRFASLSEPQACRYE